MSKLVKGYRIDNRIYIFEDEAMAIPESQIGVLPDVIYVERNLADAFKEVEANADIADLIKGYNFQTMTVNAKEWAGHEDDELEPVEEPEPEPTPDPETYIVTYDAGEDDNNPQVTVTFKSPNPQSDAYLGTDIEVSEDWFNIVSDRLNHLTDEGEDAVINANSGDLKLFFDSESTDVICLGTSAENVYATVAKETNTDTGTYRIVAAPNVDNIPTSALNFVATFDNPWYQKMQTITLTDNEYAQYVRTDVGPYPVDFECSIIPTQDAPNNLTATVVNDTTSESLSLEEQEDTDTGKTTWMFVMPDAPVTITIGVN